MTTFYTYAFNNGTLTEHTRCPPHEALLDILPLNENSEGNIQVALKTKELFQT